MNEKLINKINVIISYLKTKLEGGNYTEVNDLLNCYYDIVDDLKFGDLEHANYKLYCNFKDEGLFGGNLDAAGELYLSKNDIENGCVEYYINKSLKYVADNY